MQYNIDIVGTCNLKCPSCPVGNHGLLDYGKDRKGGFMELALFKEIIDKIQREDKGNIVVCLHNWGEPLLHPKYNSFISYLREKNLESVVSSNFNHENIDVKVVAKNMPDRFRISLSGYYQDAYSKGHVSGNIDLVKSNMYKLRYALIKQGKADELEKVEVGYHVYRHNIDNNIAMMYRLCNELNFKFSPIWAYLMSLNSLHSYLNGKYDQELEDITSKFVIPMKVAIDSASGIKTDDCRLRKEVTAINHDGSTSLCCGTFDQKDNIAESFLDHDFNELQELKYKHSLCDECFKLNLPAFFEAEKHNLLNPLGDKYLKELGCPYIINQYQLPAIADRT